MLRERFGPRLIAVQSLHNCRRGQIGQHRVTFPLADHRRTLHEQRWRNARDRNPRRVNHAQRYASASTAALVEIPASENEAIAGTA